MKPFIGRNIVGLLVLMLLFCFCSAYNSKDPRDPLGSCDEETISYCSDCFTVIICSPTSIADSAKPIVNDLSSRLSTRDTIQNCTSGNVCKEIGTYAVCESSWEEPKCECPSEGVTIIADAYDDQKYILCNDGFGTGEECPYDEYFNPETIQCQTEEVTIEPPSSTPASFSCGDEIEQLKVNCTWYAICVPDSYPVYAQCAPGEISTDNITEPCKPYLPFSCADYAGPVWTSDTTNCSVGRFCVDGEELGEPLICNESQIFDNVTKQCEDEAECSALEDCGVCPDATTTFPIDCFSYFQCSAGAEDDYLPFVPVEITCPFGYYYPDYGCTWYAPPGC